MRNASEKGSRVVFWREAGSNIWFGGVCSPLPWSEHKILYTCTWNPSPCTLFKEPRNRFLAWRPGTTTLSVVLARQATWAGGIDSSDSLITS